MQDQFLERADKAIAESERLRDELYLLVMKAKQLDKHLHFLHWVGTEEARRKKK